MCVVVRLLYGCFPVIEAQRGTWFRTRCPNCRRSRPPGHLLRIPQLYTALHMPCDVLLGAQAYTGCWLGRVIRLLCPNRAIDFVLRFVPKSGLGRCSSSPAALAWRCDALQTLVPALAAAGVRFHATKYILFLTSTSFWLWFTLLCAPDPGRHVCGRRTSGES